MPEGAKLVDGGTAGMDVGFRDARRGAVVIVDACVSRGDRRQARTVYRVPGRS